MASKADLRRRIRSVKSTQQITKAMKMVAAAKLRRAQAAITQARPYAAALSGMLASLAIHADSRRAPLLARRDEHRVTLVVVTGDKGLCGAFNSNVLRQAHTLLTGGRWPQVDLVVVGRKGSEFFKHRGFVPTAAHPDAMHSVRAADASSLARALTHGFLAGKADAVHVVYTQFRSVIQQHIAVEQLLPVAPPEGVEAPGGDLLFEPSPQALLAALVPREVEFHMLRMMLDSQAAEHASRMTAMSAAAKNAGEMIDRLTLTYNRVRQATITKELIEIVSGAQALADR